MKKPIFVFSIAFFMSYLPVFAMQELWDPKNIASIITKEIKFVRNPLAIACTCAGKLIVMDDMFATLWNYQGERVLSAVKTFLNLSEISINKIYAHPKKDIVIIPKLKGREYALYNYEDKSSIHLDCFKDRNSPVLYSEITGFYAIKNKSLIYNNFIEEEQYTLRHFSPGLTFSILDEEELCFLCCDQQEKNVYKFYIHPESNNGKSNSTDKHFSSMQSVEMLFSFSVQLDLNNWVYNPVEKALYAITHDSRQLYAALIETQQQILYPTIKDFKIGDLILANDRILVLLSQQRNKVCYIDVKSMRPLLITGHNVPKRNMRGMARGQKITIFPDGKEIIIALDRKCIGIAIPLWIVYFDAYEKYRDIIQRLYIPRELQWLVAIKFVRSITNDKKDTKKDHEIE